MNIPLSPSARKVQEALTALGLDCEVIELPNSTRTAQDAADALGCDVKQIIKSLVFMGTTTFSPILVLASGPNRVDIDKLSGHVSEPVVLADPKFVRAKTGFAIGGVPPLGHPEVLTTFLDRDLLIHEVLWAAAGTPRAVFKLSSTDLRRITDGEVVEVA